MEIKVKPNRGRVNYPQLVKNIKKQLGYDKRTKK